MKILLAIALAALLTGCSTPSQGPAVQHVVVMWLKTPGDVAARQQLIDTAQSFLFNIPGLMNVSAGQVLPSDRQATDSSFDVAMVMTFRSEAALAAYTTNPVHLNAVESTLKPLVARYVVYDFNDPSQRDPRRNQNRGSGGMQTSTPRF